VRLHVDETEPELAGTHAEAVGVLTAVRRRLVNRLALAVVLNKQQLLGRATLLDSPLTCDPRLAELAAGLCQIDQTLAALKTPPAEAMEPIDREQAEKRVSDGQSDQTFDRFSSLVNENRLEEASRELSRIFQMPHDRACTATQFFARTAQHKPVSASGLAALQEQIASGSTADSMRILMRTFGFQAVESRMAMEALRSPGPDH